MAIPAANKHPLADATDNELLMLHCQYHAGAFRELVERHGAMVLSVCRQTLRHEQDAEDAFQATFLILARKAHRLQALNSLAAWLHTVALRTSLRAAKRARRRQTEPLTDTADGSNPLEEIHGREMQRVLHQELARLPTRYRNALVLAYLEGHSREQTARRLDCRLPVDDRLCAWGAPHHPRNSPHRRVQDVQPTRMMTL